MGRVYVSRDVIFDEKVFPFSRLHPNAGARLKSEHTLLPPTLFHNYGDKTVCDHITDIPSSANVPTEIKGKNSDENLGETSSKECLQENEQDGRQKCARMQMGIQN
jgi:hypothetical protein